MVTDHTARIFAYPTRALALCFICYLCPQSPSAQAASRQVPVYANVEKGISLAAQLGFSYDFSSPVTELESGLLTGFELGYDLSWILRLKLGFCNHFFAALSRNQQGALFRTDYEASLLFGGASIALLATERISLGVQASLGYLFTHPKKIGQIQASGANDIALSVGGGIEYYTVLRHFSIGLETHLTLLPIRKNVMLSIYPVLRYTFGGGAARPDRPAADQDNDGITDANDKCPDTWGTQAQEGCPTPVEKTQPTKAGSSSQEAEHEPAESKGTTAKRVSHDDGSDRTSTAPDPPTTRSPKANAPDEFQSDEAAVLDDEALRDNEPVSADEPRADDEPMERVEPSPTKSAKANPDMAADSDTDTDTENGLDAVDQKSPETSRAETTSNETISYAGPDRTVSVGATVTLDGSGSVSKMGEPLHYRWTLTGKPNGSQAGLSDSTAAKPSFTADKAGQYEAVLETSVGPSRHADSVTITAQ